MAERAEGLGTAEYAELVARVNDVVRAHVAPGASLLVLSKGDAALVEMPGFSAAHFPQDSSGGYAGHHPRDSAAAITALEQLRRGGAQYLVIPATALWWLDFYGEFAQHLSAHGELVADVEGACLIFDLGASLQPARAEPARAPRASAEELRDYLQRLLSSDSRLVVLDTGEGLVGQLAPLHAAAIPARELHEDAAALETLAGLAAQGAEYLVLPAAAQEWLSCRPGVSADIEARCRKVAEQRYLCRVFELRGLWEQA